MKKFSTILCAIGAALVSAHAAAFTFTPGNAYASGDSAIFEYDAAGQLLSTRPTATEPRGLAFGPDGHLYVVRVGGDPTDNPTVDVLREDGTLVRSYTIAHPIWSNLSYGKICFDRAGTHFYVGTSAGVVKFAIGATDGTLITSAGAFDVSVLPNDDLFVVTSYARSRYDSAGVLQNSVDTLSDPLNLGNTGQMIYLTDVRGVEYDARKDRTFLTMLGHSGLGFKIFELIGDSNVVSRVQTYHYADDVFATDSRRVLVGSRTLAPGVFSDQLHYLQPVGTTAARFVTALPEHLFSDDLEAP